MTRRYSVEVDRDPAPGTGGYMIVDNSNGMVVARRKTRELANALAEAYEHQFSIGLRR